MTDTFFFSCQANNFGVGVVGVIECDFLQPTHNKQDFDYRSPYNSSYDTQPHSLIVNRVNRDALKNFSVHRD